MEQLIDLNRSLRGAASSDLCDAHNLAEEAWCESCREPNSGLLSFAYLWRRFGPPWSGGDDHKSLVDYTLTTTDPDVFLWMHPNGSRLSLCVGYLITEAIREPWLEWEERFQEWWLQQHPEFDGCEATTDHNQKVFAAYIRDRERTEIVDVAAKDIGNPPRLDASRWREDTGVVHRVNSAIFDAMRELLRPVYVRDVAINLFGRCDDSDDSAERSPYAGYGIPKEAIDAFVTGE